MKDYHVFLVVIVLAILIMFGVVGYESHIRHLACIENGGSIVGEKCFRLCIGEEIEVH